MNLIQLGTKSVSTLRKARHNHQKQKSSREFVKTRNVTITYCRPYMMSPLNDKLFTYYNTLFYNFDPSIPVNSFENKRKDPNGTMEITNAITKFVGKLSKRKEAHTIKLESNTEELKLDKQNIEQQSIKNKLTQQNLTLLDANSRMSTDYSQSLSSKTSDDNVLNCIGNALNDIGNALNGTNEILIEYEEKTNGYCDMYEDELRNKIQQELSTKIKGDMTKEFYERELKFKSQLSTLQSALNESLANNASQRIEIAEERKTNKVLQNASNDQLNKILELQNENKELRRQLKDTQNEIDCFQIGIRTSLAELKFPVRNRGKITINNCDAGHESDSESSVLTQLSDKYSKAKDVLDFIDIPAPILIDDMINDKLNDKLNNKLKYELRKILTEVLINDDDDEDEQKLDLYSVMNVFGEQNAGAMTEVFDQLTDENDDCDFGEFTIDTIINGIIVSDDLKNKLIKTLDVKIEMDINTVDMDNMTPLILPTNITETQPNSEPFVPIWRK